MKIKTATWTVYDSTGLTRKFRTKTDLSSFTFTYGIRERNNSEADIITGSAAIAQETVNGTQYWVVTIEPSYEALQALPYGTYQMWINIKSGTAPATKFFDATLQRSKA